MAMHAALCGSQGVLRSLLTSCLVVVRQRKGRADILMSEIKTLWLSHLCLTAYQIWCILNCCCGRIHLLLDVAAVKHTRLHTVTLIRGVFQHWGVHAWAAAQGSFFTLCERREILVFPTLSSIRTSGASWDMVTPSEMSRVNTSFWVMFIGL